MSEATYEIVQEDGHYAVYIDGVFYCTADTAVEAAVEISKYESGEG